MGDSAVKKSGYPLGFYLSCITYTFERFAFYGSKPLLILFLLAAVNNGGLGISKVEAGFLTAQFTAWTYVAPVLGGYICDHWLGARYSVTLGSILMAIGYLFGWKADSTTDVILMIIIVSVGTGFFKGNLTSLMGRLIDDPKKKDSAFSIVYAFVNIGATFGSAIMGYAYLYTFKQGDILGFRDCFLWCAVSVLVGGIIFTLSYPKLKGQGKKPFKYNVDENGNVIETADSSKEKALNAKDNSEAKLTSVQKSRVSAILIVVFVSILFWFFYFQQDIALTIYMSEYVDMKIGSFTLSPAHVTTTWNGILCVALSLAAAKLWNKLAQRPQGDLSMFKKVALAFLFMGIAYVILIAMEISRGVGAPDSVKVSVLWLFVFSIFLTLGEIAFSPLGSSFVSKYAPKKYLSVLMGVWFFATFAANQLNGITEKFVQSLGIYTIFVIFAIISFVGAISMFVLDKSLKKLLHDDKLDEEEQ